MDRLASEGMSFTDTHSGSSFCTPSRYGILTGRYAWRTHLQSGVLSGLSKPLIAPGQLTVPKMLKDKGYATGAIGKWHMGMTFGDNTYADEIKDDPLQHGFDCYFGISASLDMPPFAYIKNQRFTEVPTAMLAPSFEIVPSWCPIRLAIDVGNAIVESAKLVTTGASRREVREERATVGDGGDSLPPAVGGRQYQEPALLPSGVTAGALVARAVPRLLCPCHLKCQG